MDESHETQHVGPIRSRPRLPEGYGVPADEEGMLPWSHAVEVLRSAPNYWVGTTRPDGRPHATPVWGAVIDGTLYIEGSPETRRGRNLAANPAVVVHVERAEDVVIIEGTADELGRPDPTLGAKLTEVMAAKYGPSHEYRPSPDDWNEGGLHVIRPRVAFAWNKFPRTMTRWTFGDA